MQSVSIPSIAAHCAEHNHAHSRGHLARFACVQQMAPPGSPNLLLMLAEQSSHGKALEGALLWVHSSGGSCFGTVRQDGLAAAAAATIGSFRADTPPESTGHTFAHNSGHGLEPQV